MSFESITGLRLEELCLMKKRVTNPQTKRKPKDKHEQVNYLAVNATPLRPKKRLPDSIFMYGKV